MTCDFDPSVRSLNLCVPAVVGVVSHLSASVLSEANTIRLDTASQQELVSTGAKVTQGLVADNALLNSITDGHHCWNHVGVILLLGTEKWHGDILQRVKFGVALVKGVHEVLNLSHGELSHSEETLSWRDLVSETHTDLGSREWHSSVVKFDEAAEVDENALSSLWAEVSLHLTSWSDHRVEHQIEWLSVGERVSSVWVLDFQLGNALVDLLWRVVLNIDVDFLELFSLLRLLFLWQNFGDVFLDKFIGASRSASLCILDHEVFELVNVT